MEIFWRDFNPKSGDEKIEKYRVFQNLSPPLPGLEQGGNRAGSTVFRPEGVCHALRVCVLVLARTVWHCSAGPFSPLHIFPLPPCAPHALTHTHTHAHIYTRAHTHTLTYTPPHARTHARACTPTCTQNPTMTLFLVGDDVLWAPTMSFGRCVDVMLTLF